MVVHTSCHGETRGRAAVPCFEVRTLCDAPRPLVHKVQHCAPRLRRDLVTQLPPQTGTSFQPRANHPDRMAYDNVELVKARGRFVLHRLG
jgi:hypothetical protein